MSLPTFLASGHRRLMATTLRFDPYAQYSRFFCDRSAIVLPIASILVSTRDRRRLIRSSLLGFGFVMIVSDFVVFIICLRQEPDGDEVCHELAGRATGHAGS